MAENLKGRETASRLTLLDRVWLNEDAFELKCSRPDDFSFLPGQHVSFYLDDLSREYTMISRPEDSCLRFLIKRIRGGKLSSLLAELPLPAEIAVSSPAGYLVDRASPQARVFVATGTGIAPFISMARSGVRDFTLIQGARERSGLFYEDELEPAAARYIRCLTSPGESPVGDGDFYEGRVTSFLKERLPAGQYAFYLCGVWEMIQEVTHIIDDRFPSSMIYSEVY